MSDELDLQAAAERSKCVVDRRTWYRGRGALGSALFRVDGQRCCVGFYAEQVLGAKADCILNYPTLTRAGYYDPIIKDPTVNNIYTVNDSLSIEDEEQRERLLIDGFARVLNCDLSFTDGDTVES